MLTRRLLLPLAVAAAGHYHACMTTPLTDTERRLFTGCAIGLPDEDCRYPACLSDEGVCLHPAPEEDVSPTLFNTC